MQFITILYLIPAIFVYAFYLIYYLWCTTLHDCHKITFLRVIIIKGQLVKKFEGKKKIQNLKIDLQGVKLNGEKVLYK